MKKLSIITINLNNGSGLERTIKSVLQQNFKDVEHIVIDGGSTDGSVEIIKKYTGNISYWISEKDKGVYNAMNKGIAQATGEYCQFLNSGDYLADDKVLEKMFAHNYPADILYGHMLIDWGKGKTKLGKMPQNISLYHMYVDTLWHPVSFIKRQLFEQLGHYDESYKIAGDYEFFVRAIIHEKCTTQQLPVVIAVFFLNGLSSLPASKAIEKEERQRVINKYLSEQQINGAEAQLQATTIKNAKLINRIINKLKR